MTGDENHVHFDTIDAAAEEERSARGQQHRKDLVRGFRLQKENEKMFRGVQMKAGYDWLAAFKDETELKALEFGLQMTVYGFLSFFYGATSEDTSSPEDLGVLFKHFQSSSVGPEILDLKLQEYLILIALLVHEKDYGLGVSDGVEDVLHLHGSDPKLLRVDTP